MPNKNSLAAQAPVRIAGNPDTSDTYSPHSVPFALGCQELVPIEDEVLNLDPLRRGTIDLLEDQIKRGFRPQLMLTFHYGNPYERGWDQNRRIQNRGTQTTSSTPLLLDSPTGRGITISRNDIIKVSRDAKHIRNLLLRGVWGVQRLDKHEESQTPMIFFHEKGREKIQYHTHVLVGGIPQSKLNENTLKSIWLREVAPKARCLSRTNSLDITNVDSSTRAIRYLTKEIRGDETVLDVEASCLITPGMRF